MKPRTVIVLLVLLTLSVGYLALRKSGVFKPGKKNKPAEPAALFDPQTSSITKLTIAPAGGKPISLVKVEDEWRIVAPIQARAENYAVSEITNALESLKGTPVKDKDAKPELTGLDQPRCTLTFTGAEGGQRVVHVGKAPPMSRDELYVRIGDDKQPYVVKASISDALDRPLSEYRSKTVLDIKKEDVIGVTVRGAREFTLAKDNEKKWTLRSGSSKLGTPADTKKVEDLIGKFTWLSAGKFADKVTPALAGLEADKARLALTVTMPAKEKDAPSTQPATQPAGPKPGKVYKLLLGGPAGLKGDKLYARFADEDTVFTLDTSLLKDLQPELNTLRSKTIVKIDTDKVTRVVLDLPGQDQTVLENDGFMWRMQKPYKVSANSSAVKGLISAVNDLKAKRFLETAGELGSDAATVSLHMAAMTTTVKVGKATPSGELTYVQAGNAGELVLVDTDQVKKLLAAPATYRNTRLWSKPFAENVAGLKIERTGQEPIALARDAKVGTWSMTAPVQAKADKAAVQAAVNRLKSISADKIVAMGAKIPAKYADAKDQITIRLTTELPKPKPQPRPTTQPATKPAPKAPTPTPAPEPAKKPAAKPAAKPTKKPAAKPAKKPVAKSTTKPAAKPAPKPAVKPATKTYVIHLAKIDNACYVWIEGEKIPAVGKMTFTAIWDDLTAEMRDRQVLDVDKDKVVGLTLTVGGKKIELKKVDKVWKDATDALLVIDGEKVEKFLGEVTPMNAEKFASHTATGAKFGLDKPERTLTLRLAKGKPITLAVSKQGPADTKNRYATLTGVQGVFVLKEDTVRKLDKTLKDFMKE